MHALGTNRGEDAATDPAPLPLVRDLVEAPIAAWGFGDGDQPLLRHRLLLHWLVARLRPARAVILGADDLVAHAILAEAAAAAGLDQHRLALGHWRDPGPTRPAGEILRLAHALDRGAGAELIATEPAAAADTIAQPAPDLLFVDLVSAPWAAQHLRALLDRPGPAAGLILIHGAATLEQAMAADGALATQLQAHPTIRLPAGAGLIAALAAKPADPLVAALWRLGPDLPPPLPGLIARLSLPAAPDAAADVDAAPAPKSPKALARRLARIEAAHNTLADAASTLRVRLFDTEAALSDCRTELGAAAQATRTLETALARERAEAEATRRLLEQATATAAETRAALAEAQAEGALASAELAASRRASEALKTALQSARERAARLERRLARRDLALEERSRERAEQGRRIAALEADLATRFEETAQLTRLIEETRRTTRDKAEAAIAELKRALDQAEGSLRETRAELARITEDRDRARQRAAEVEALLLRHVHATTWRAMAPVRWAVRCLRGQPPPPKFRPQYLGGKQGQVFGR